VAPSPPGARALARRVTLVGSSYAAALQGIPWGTTVRPHRGPRLRNPPTLEIVLL